MKWDKYNPLKDKTEGNEKPSQVIDAVVPMERGVQSWKDSTPVVLLSEYLKRYPDNGIKLYQREGELVLRFEPGLERKDIGSERWQIASNAVRLFTDAAADLIHLMTNGLIDIPAYPGTMRVLPGACNDTAGKTANNLCI